MTSSVWLYNHPNFDFFIALWGVWFFLSLEKNQNRDDHTNIIQLLYKD